MRIQLSYHFTYGRLLRFTLPSMIMMVFTSIYGMVDGFFISNFVGKTSFAAINLIYPMFMIIGSVGMMLGAGGTAVIGKTLGEGKRELANKYFSMVVYVVLAFGVFSAIIALFLLRTVAQALGAEGEMLENCVKYGRILCPALPFLMIQFSTQSFFVVAEKPKLGLVATLLGGGTNMVLDALFVAVFKWGLQGAAAATAISQLVTAGFALIYFSRKNTSLLKLTLKTKIYGKTLLNVCTNGSSEMVTNIAASIVTIVYNTQLMKYFGENGVAAYGVVMYVNFIFAAIYFGYAMGCSPVLSYHYGANNTDELKNLLKKSLTMIGIAGVLMLIISRIASPMLVKIFVGYDAELYNLTCHAFKIYSFAFLIMGYSVFGSSFFTALNNGGVSAAISFIRTFIFETGSVLLLPIIFGSDGIWGAVVAAEIAAAIVTTAFLAANRKKYNY